MRGLSIVGKIFPTNEYLLIVVVFYYAFFSFPINYLEAYWEQTVAVQLERLLWPLHV